MIENKGDFKVTWTIYNYQIWYYYSSDFMKGRECEYIWIIYNDLDYQEKSYFNNYALVPHNNFMFVWKILKIKQDKFESDAKFVFIMQSNLYINTILTRKFWKDLNKAIRSYLHF